MIGRLVCAERQFDHMYNVLNLDFRAASRQETSQNAKISSGAAAPVPASQPASQFPISSKKLEQIPALSFQRLVSKTQDLTVGREYSSEYFLLTTFLWIL